MPNRNMYVGDSYPPMRFQLMSGGRLINLSSAIGILVTFKGATRTFAGSGTALWPAVLDQDGMHRWNLSYSFQPTDTSTADTFKIYVTVTWPQGIQTFSTTDKLIVSTE